MGSTEQSRAVRVWAPGPNRIIRLPVTTTSTTRAFPPAWLGGWITAIPRIAVVTFNVGGSTVSVDATEQNAGTPPGITLSPTVGLPLEPGDPFPFQLKPGETHFAVDAEAAAEIALYLSGAALRIP